MSRCTSTVPAIGLIVVLGAGCSVWNRVDVCEQKEPAPVTINQRFEGLQLTGGPGTTVPLPGGNALVVFASEVGGRDPREATEVRSVRVTADGSRLPSCEKNDMLDDVLVAVDATDAQQQLRETVYAAGPLGPNRTGLVTYKAVEGDRPPEIRGLFFQSNGCPYITGSDRRKSFLIAASAPDDEVFGPLVVSLGVGKPDDDFLVVWQELSKGVIYGRARVVRMNPSGPVFLETALARDGGVATLPAVPNILWGLAAARVGPNIAIAAHYSVSSNDSNVLVWFYDDHLNMIGTPVQVSKDQPRGELLPGRDLTAAYDGRTLLIGWMQNDRSGRVRMFMRALDGDGRPRGPAFRVGTRDDVTDNYPIAAAWPDYGFLVGWRQQGGQGDVGPRLLGRVLDGSGRPTFTANACGEEPFVIAHHNTGDRRQPAIAALESNDVLAVWTDDSKSGADTSGSAIHGRVLKVEGLFVGTSRPGSGKSAPPVVDAGAASAGPDADPVNMCEMPGSVRGGNPCLCDSDCESGGDCAVEESISFPGGVCIQACKMSDPSSCGPGGVCRGNAMAGFCYPACQTHADCAPGRACTGKPRACMPHCSSDDQCRSGHCDGYRSFCGVDDQPLPGVGLFAPCLRNDDCRSRLCSTVNNRCLTTCHIAMPNCPEDGVCVPFPDGDGGLCLPPCPDSGTCADPMLTCRTQMGVARKFCF